MSKVALYQGIERGSVQWYQSLTPSDYQTLINHLRDKARELLGYSYSSNYNWEFEDTIRSNIMDTLYLLGRQDITNPVFATHVHHVFTKDFEKLLRVCSRYDSDHKASWWSSFFIKNRTSRFKKRAAKITRSPRPRVNEFSMLDGLPELKVDRGILEAKEVSSGFVSVNNKVAAINLLLQKAGRLQLTSEDSYFVDQVKTEYLNQILSAAESMRDSSKSQRNEAETHFVNQLNLVEQKLTEILEAHVTLTLEAVRSQTNFLTTSLTEPDSQASPLALTKRPSKVQKMLAR